MVISHDNIIGRISYGIFKAGYIIQLGNIASCTGHRIIDTGNLCFLCIISFVSSAHSHGRTTALSILYNPHQSLLQSFW